MSYLITFTGGPFENGVQINFAPESGSFSYDPNSGFSNFMVNYNGDVFDFTSAANVPSICTAPGSCLPGTPAQELDELLNHNSWLDMENSSFSFGVVGINTLSLGDFHGQISATSSGFSNFTATSPPAVGTFTVTAVPEPRALKLLAVTLLLGIFATIKRWFPACSRQTA